MFHVKRFWQFSSGERNTNRERSALKWSALKKIRGPSASLGMTRRKDDREKLETTGVILSEGCGAKNLDGRSGVRRWLRAHRGITNGG
jgi:hypothetical protein